jgi:hypothetical protein
MIKFKDMPKAAQVIVSAGAVSTALVAIAVPAVWALDTRYVTIGSVEQAFLIRDVRDIKRMIRRLQFLVDTGQATDLDVFELQGLNDELEELTE